MDSRLSGYVPSEWTLVAANDQSADWEIDVTEVYLNGGVLVLASASGCSCWDGDYTTETFGSIDALEAFLREQDRPYHLSPAGAAQLVAECRERLVARVRAD